jgi:hypothetical protein
MRRDPESAAALAAMDKKRAAERAALASRPKDPWLTRDRFALEARDPVVPDKFSRRGARSA